MIFTKLNLWLFGCLENIWLFQHLLQIRHFGVLANCSFPLIVFIVFEILIHEVFDLLLVLLRVS